jgi:4-nitrophenol 2-monooxygenase / 4-nitrocatechol 4-monooxygenase, reductase component
MIDRDEPRGLHGAQAVGGARPPAVSLTKEFAMPVGAQEFRAALGHFASSVNVVTTRLADGQLAGITVTAFCSVSLQPPLVLICIDKRARLHDALAAGQPFAVNMLAADQEVISRRFASSDPNQFAGIGYTTGNDGTPWLDEALAVVECRFVEQYPGGDHTIIVGQVEATRIRESKPLLYFRGGYAQLA